MGGWKKEDTFHAIAFVLAVATQQYWLAGMIAISWGVSQIYDDNVDDPEIYGKKLQQNTRSTQEPVRVVYGKVKLGGNDVYINSTGENNKHLWIVQTLCEGECEGIEQIGSAWQIWLDDRLVSTYGNKVSWTFHGGSSDQTKDSGLFAADSDWTDPLRNTCYIVWRLVYDTDLFLRAPARVLVLEGLKVYDFRDGTTAWSDNPVLCLYDFMTNTRYGMGISSTQIDITSWTAAANYCDVEKGWTINLGIISFANADTIISQICATFRGQPVWYNNKLYLYYADLNYEPSLMNIGNEHIAVSPTTGKAMISMSGPSRFGIPDGLRVSFVDPNKDYSVDFIPVGEAVGVIQQISMVGVTDKQQALDLATYNLERMQRADTIDGTFRDDLAKLSPHDVVRITSDALTISGELVRVMSTNIRPDGLVDISFISEILSLYDDDYQLIEESTFDCTLPDPFEVPPEVQNATIEEELYWYRLRSFSRLIIEFDPPGDYPWFRHCEVWRSWDNSTWEYLYNVNTDFTIDPVEEGVTYFIRLRPVSINHVKRPLADSTSLNRTVAGKTTAPVSLASLTAIPTDSGINIYGDKVNDPDVELYEFRLGNSWSGGIFLSAGRSPNLSLTGAKPGSFIFFCNTLGNNNVYGDTPVSASATVPDPKGRSLSIDISGEYEDGTFINAKQFAYDADWYLKCSHSGECVTYPVGYTVFHTGGPFPMSYERGQGYVPLRNIPSGEFPGFQALLKREGSPSGNLYARLYDDDGEPNEVLAISQGVDVSSIGTLSGEWVSFNFLSVPPLVQDTQYWFVLNGNEWTGDEDNTLGWAYDETDPYPFGGGSQRKPYDSWIWSWIHLNFICDKYVGRYSSPIFDLEDYDPTVVSPETFLSFIEADIVVTGTGTQWQDVLYDGVTKLKWSEVGVATRRWYEIFSLPEAPKVHMKMTWGASELAMNNEADRMEILSTVLTAKFVQFHVTIEDPSASVSALVENYHIKSYQ